jgi:hypothetical protein
MKTSFISNSILLLIFIEVSPWSRVKIVGSTQIDSLTWKKVILSWPNFLINLFKIVRADVIWTNAVLIVSQFVLTWNLIYLWIVWKGAFTFDWMWSLWRPRSLSGRLVEHLMWLIGCFFYLLSEIDEQ